jgi:6-phosphogluconolactonase
MAIYELELPIGLMAHSCADVERHAEALTLAVAGALRSALETYGQASLVVSGGRSPVPFFERLSRETLDWARVQISLADERWVAVEHAASNEGLVRRHLLQGPAAAASFLGLYHPAPSLDEAALLADRALAALQQPIDVLVLGMGDDGHTASLFPASPRLSEALESESHRRCLPMQAPVEPRERLTLTLPLLASARLPLLAIQGAAKLETLRLALAGENIAAMPIRAFLHSPLEIYWCP